MHKITVVGLGPGSAGQLSVETMELLKNGECVILRTAVHPSVSRLTEEKVNFTSCDNFYFPVEITPAAIFCGSSSFCVCVATTAGDVAMAAATVTAAGSSLFCSCCAATMAVAAAADSRFRFFAEQGIFSPAFCSCFICYLRHFRLLFSSRFLTFSFCFLFSCRSFGLQ